MNRSLALSGADRSAKFSEVKPLTGKDIPQPLRGAGQKHLQQHAEGKGGDGIADEHQDTAGDIKPGAVFDGLGYAQGDADQVSQEKPGQSEYQ